jgi:peptide deformylase
MGLERAEMEEGCVSFPLTFLKIPRSTSIKVRFADPYGDVTTMTFAGMTARVFAHELDHLDGRLFTDYVSKLKFDMARKKAVKLEKNRANRAAEQTLRHDDWVQETLENSNKI